MPRYIDLEELVRRINKYVKPANQDEKELVEWCRDECIRQGYWLPTADVVPRAEYNELLYKLEGVMHSVDKWLDGEELNQDEVNRAATMREKTLRIVEGYQMQIKATIDFYENREKEIFDEVDKTIELICTMTGVNVVLFGRYADLKKKYTEGGDEG